MLPDFSIPPGNLIFLCFKCGVPQAWVLGPTLYPRTCDRSAVLFTDGESFNFSFDYPQMDLPMKAMGPVAFSSLKEGRQVVFSSAELSQG